MVGIFIANYKRTVSGSENSAGIKVIRGSLMDAKEYPGGLKITLPAGESTSAVIWMKNKSTDNFNSLTIKKNDIKTDSGEIFPEQNIDERIAYTWRQKIFSLTPHQNSPTFGDVEELLVKTNKINYLDTRITTSNLPNHLGYLQDGRNDTDFSLDARKNQKAILKITAPQKTGDYHGSIRISDKQSGKVLGSLNIRIRVSGIKLINPVEKGYLPGCFSNDRILAPGVIPPSSGEFKFISSELYKKRLQLAHEAGCESLIITATERDDYLTALKIIQDLGFKGKVIINFHYVNANNNEIKFNPLDTLAAKGQLKDFIKKIIDDPQIKIPIAFYALDEANVIGNSEPNNYDNNLKRISIIRQVIAQLGNRGTILDEVDSTVVPDIFLKIQSETNPIFQEFQPILNYNYNIPCEGMHIPGLECQTPIAQLFDRLKQDQGSAPKSASYYFQGTREQPIRNRYLGGLGLIYSGLKQYYLNPVWGFYSETSPIFSEDSYTGRLISKKHNMTFYPARDGLLPTIQSEAWHEGVMDIKYYLTYLDNKEKAASSCSVEQADHLSEISESIEDGDQSMSKLSYDFPDFNLDNLRQKLENYVFYFAENCSVQNPPRTLTVTAKKGFTSLGALADVNIKDFTSQGLVVFRYNSDVQNNWIRYRSSSDDRIIPASNGFYLFNPNSDKKVTYTLQNRAQTEGTIKPGWNLLWTNKDMTADEVKLKVELNQEQCLTAKLQDLIDQSVIYHDIFVINKDEWDNEYPAECQVFKLLWQSSTNKPCYEKGDYSTIDHIPSRKAFWVYLWPNKLDQINSSPENCN